MNAAGAGRASSLIELVTTWACRAVALSLNWLAQVLAGLVIAGIAPATLTLYHQVRLGLDDLVLPGYYRRSWSYWRRQLVPAQKYLLLPMLTVVVLWFYLRMAAGTPVAVPLAVLTAVYVIWLILLPAWLTADGADSPLTGGVAARWGQAWQLLAIGALPCLLAGVIAGAGTGVLVWYFPGAAVLFCPTGIAVLASIAAQRTHERALRHSRRSPSR